MEFKDKFKNGDVICSDHFWNGKLMVVEGFVNVKHSKFYYKERYVCLDMFKEKLTWSAHQFQSFGDSYNWRIATDEDYVREIEKLIDQQETYGKEFEVTISAEKDRIEIYDESLGESVFLEPEAALQVADFIYKKVGR